MQCRDSEDHHPHISNADRTKFLYFLTLFHNKFWFKLQNLIKKMSNSIFFISLQHCISGSQSDQWDFVKWVVLNGRVSMKIFYPINLCWEVKWEDTRINQNPDSPQTTWYSLPTLHSTFINYMSGYHFFIGYLDKLDWIAELVKHPHGNSSPPEIRITVTPIMRFLIFFFD